MSALRASAVSRVLHRGGFRPLPSGTSRDREGIRVRQGVTYVSVTADIDSGTAAVLADEMFDVLASRGYTVKRMSPTRLWVTG